jgi:hypothetical protein
VATPAFWQRRRSIVEGAAARDEDSGRRVVVGTGDDECRLLWCEAGCAIAPATREFGIWSRRTRQ